MKKNLLQKLTLVALSIMVLEGCASYKHTYRISDIPSKDQKVGESYVYDVQPDVTKKVTAESGKHRSSKNATNDAYYKAIVENNIHIVVDPIYEVRKSPRFLIFGGKFTAKVSGFAGSYVNPRTESEFALFKQKQESDIFKAELERAKMTADAEAVRNGQQIDNFTKLAKVDVLNTVQQQTSIIDKKGRRCCSGNGTTLQLATTTTTKPSLVDEYNKLISKNCGSSKSTASKRKGCRLFGKK